MAATTIRDLLVRLGVDADTKQLAAFDTGLRTVVKGLTALAAVGTATLLGLGAIASSTAHAGDEAAKAAKRLGLTTAEFQELSFAAQRSGADISVMEVALRTVARTARDASIGVGTGKLAFDKLGINVLDANGELKRTPDLLDEAATALAGLSNESEQIALAQDMFGRGGSQLLPLLLEGAEGIDLLRRRARELGFVLDEQVARQAEEFQDALLDAQLAATGLKTTIGAALIPIGIEFLNWLGDTIVAMQPYVSGFLDMIESTIGLKNAIFGLIGVTAALSTAATTLAGILGLGAVVAAISSIAAGVSGLIATLTAMAATVGLTLAPFLGLLAVAAAAVVATIAQMVAIVTTAALVWEDFFVFMRGGNSALGEFLKKYSEAEGPLGSVARAVLKLGDVLGALLVLGGEVGALIGLILAPVFEVLGVATGTLSEMLIGLLGLLGELLLGQIGAFAEEAIVALTAVAAIVGAVTDGVSSLVALISSASNFASGLSLPSILGGGGGTTNSTTNNLSVNAPATISTTASASETAQVIGSGISDVVRRAMPDLLGAEQ